MTDTHVAMPMAKPISGWTDERVELLKKLWSDGLSASQSAKVLGGVTRNAVIGKVHRLGLSGRAKSRSWAMPGAPHPRKHKPRVARPALRVSIPAQAFQYEASELVADNVVPISQRCGILELTNDTCRWPIGDPGEPEFCFCGGQTATGLPYCGYHSRIAYLPVSNRRVTVPLRCSR